MKGSDFINLLKTLAWASGLAQEGDDVIKVAHVGELLTDAKSMEPGKTRRYLVTEVVSYGGIVGSVESLSNDERQFTCDFVQCGPFTVTCT